MPTRSSSLVEQRNCKMVHFVQVFVFFEAFGQRCPSPFLANANVLSDKISKQQQAYKVLGHIDILGDPLSLGMNISSGVIGFVTKVRRDRCRYNPLLIPAARRPTARHPLRQTRPSCARNTANKAFPSHGAGRGVATFGSRV